MLAAMDPGTFQAIVLVLLAIILLCVLVPFARR